MSNIFLRFPFPCAFKSVECKRNGIFYSDLQSIISRSIGFSDFDLYCNGKKVLKGNHVLPNSTVHVSFTLPGGKGGFGSMLRAIGAQIEKTTNREACRDLSGRRLRDINEEQRLKNWIAKKSEREAEKMRRRKERLERLKSRPKHNFVDFEYEKEISALPERIDDALSAGIEKAKKRPTEMNEPSTSSDRKKKRLWLEEDISDSSESDTDSSKSNEQSDELQMSSNITSSHADAEASCSSESSSTFKEDEESAECSATSSSHVKKMETTESQGDAETMSTISNQEAEAPNSSECLEKKNDSQAETSKLESESSPIDLDSYHSAKELEALGLDKLKNELMLRGLKCGGNLSDRAGRLWAIRGLNPDQYPKNFFAIQKKKK